MRRKINNELKQYLLEFAKDKTIDELLPLVNGMVEQPYNRDQLQNYLIRNWIPYKLSKPKKSNYNNTLPIGTERVTKEGRVKIKVGKGKWVYKARYMYEKYHNVALTDDDRIVQIDKNFNNFNKDNLVKISRYESSHLVYYTLKPNQPEYNKTVLGIIKLEIGIKDYEKRNS